MIRSHAAGSLRAEHVGQEVTLAGWVARRRDHGGVAFVDLRDSSGVVQVVIRDEEVASPLRSEFCLRVVGVVSARPAGNANPALPTGEIEVVAHGGADGVQVLSEAAALPFPVEEHHTTPVGEEVRLRYRYLDLRRPEMARAIRQRARVTELIREVMAANDFLDVETPYLTRSTPEGARDFLVPVRLQPGHWYALPQSPQLFKQLLMVAGLERYYQIVRCFRDEDFRADRQPEFTQLDVELSFADADDVIALTEQVLARLWADVLGVQVSTPFPRMTHAEALRRFGIDRPDLRFGCELVDLTGFFAETPFRVFQRADRTDWHVGAVVMPGGAAQSRKQLDGWQEWARSRGAKGLGYVLVTGTDGTDGTDGADGTDGTDGTTPTLGGPIAKNLSEAERAGFVDAVGARPGDCVFLAAGPRAEALALLAATRLEVGARCDLIDHSRWEFCWVVDFPMFEPAERPDGSTGWTAVHHPFTAPLAEDAADFHERPGEALSRAYDIVLNGTELGGGSIRIHRADVQQRVFDVIGLGPDEARSQFGFLLDAFDYGPPPHGGIAIGLDRLCALLAGVGSIRDVIAFPKTASGGDPLTGAPSPITAAQRREAGVDATPAGAAFAHE